MNISAYILEYLKQFGTVTVPDFGVFSLEKSKAVVNSENGSILPPARTIVYAPDDEVKSDELAAFIAGQKQMTLEASKTDLQIQTDFWKKKLQAEQMLELQGLGTVYIEAGASRFKGNRLQSDHPDFYGLEEIIISDMHTDSSTPAAVSDTEKDYRFNKSILWAFLIIIPVLGIVYVAYTQQELLFGKKSFDNTHISVQTKTHRIQKDTVKVQQHAAPVTDSLKKDSVIRKTILPVTHKSVPVQPAAKSQTKNQEIPNNTKK